MTINDDQIRFAELKQRITTLIDWQRFMNALERYQNGDETAEAELDEELMNLMRAIDRTNFDYKNQTFQIRTDLFEEVRLFCAENGVSQKVFANAAFEMYLHWRTYTSNKK